MSKLKDIVDHLILKEIYKPQENFKNILGNSKQEDSENQNFIITHPFSGFLGSLICLLSNLSFIKNQKLENYWTSEIGWKHIGLILAHTKMDIDNPTLREWCIFFIRNITSWSDNIRNKLSELTLLSGSDPNDPESIKSLEALGKPLQ